MVLKLRWMGILLGIVSTLPLTACNRAEDGDDGSDILARSAGTLSTSCTLSAENSDLFPDASGATLKFTGTPRYPMKVEVKGQGLSLTAGRKEIQKGSSATQIQGKKNGYWWVLSMKTSSGKLTGGSLVFTKGEASDTFKLRDCSDEGTSSSRSARSSATSSSGSVSTASSSGSAGTTGESSAGSGNAVRINCSSEVWWPHKCRQKSVISAARLVSQKSTSPCDEGVTWGVKGDYLWVSDGCRADFEIVLE